MNKRYITTIHPPKRTELNKEFLDNFDNYLIVSCPFSLRGDLSPYDLVDANLHTTILITVDSDDDISLYIFNKKSNEMRVYLNSDNISYKEGRRFIFSDVYHTNNDGSSIKVCIFYLDEDNVFIIKPYSYVTLTSLNSIRDENFKNRIIQEVNLKLIEDNV